MIDLVYISNLKGVECFRKSQGYNESNKLSVELIPSYKLRERNL